MKYVLCLFTGYVGISSSDFTMSTSSAPIATHIFVSQLVPTLSGEHCDGIVVGILIARTTVCYDIRDSSQSMPALPCPISTGNLNMKLPCVTYYIPPALSVFPVGIGWF